MGAEKPTDQADLGRPQPGRAAAVGEQPPRAGGAGRRQRRANAHSQARSLVQKVKVTPAELVALRGRAREAGVSVPRLLVESAMVRDRDTVTARGRLATELMGTHRTLAGVAINMNQVARKANTVHEVPADFARVFEELRRVGAKLEGVVDQLTEANRRDGLEVDAP